MLIDWAVLCRYAESNGTVATIVGAGIDMLTVPAMPTLVAVMVAIRLAAPADEFVGGVQHEVTCRVLDPTGAPVLAEDDTPAEELKLGFSAPEGGVQQTVPGWLVNPLFAFQIAWIVREPGTYSVETRVGDHAHLSPIHVLLAEPPPAG